MKKPVDQTYISGFEAENSTTTHYGASEQFDKERQSVILQSIGDAVIATDIDGHIILMNPVAEKLTGWPFQDAQNKPVSEVFHIIDKLSREESANPIESVLKTGTKIKLAPNTVLISRDQKHEFAISDSCAPILNTKGTIMGVVLVFRDITKQRQEETLKEKITEDLIQRNKDHEHFDNIISHDLKSPISNILSLSTLLNDNDLEEVERDLMMKALVTSAERLNEVIVDLNVILSVGKQLVQKKENVHFSTLVTVIKESIANILEKENANFSVDFNEVDELYTIKSYMYSIFYNLISNSIKYRRQDIPLEIGIKSELVANAIVLTFKDNGLGIDLTTHNKDLFGLYQRFHTKKADGKGMGLYMVKAQVEKLGGTISVKSKVNEGTEFTIVLVSAN